MTPRHHGLTTPFDLQPSLRGELLGLRPLGEEDFEDLYAVAADPLIWEQHPEQARYRREVFNSFFDNAIDSRGALAVIDNKSRCLIGSSRFHGYDEERSEVEIGWTFLGRSYWGGFYNRELKRLMLSHAFQRVGSVIFVVGPDNLRSQRAVERIGGVRTGLRQDGSGRQGLLYRIDADRWSDAPV